jgi:hypothetical protein
MRCLTCAHLGTLPHVCLFIRSVASVTPSSCPLTICIAFPGFSLVVRRSSLRGINNPPFLLWTGSVLSQLGMHSPLCLFSSAEQQSLISMWSNLTVFLPLVICVFSVLIRMGFFPTQVRNLSSLIFLHSLQGSSCGVFCCCCCCFFGTGV